MGKNHAEKSRVFDMGRKPKPTEQKRRAGNPGRRPLNESEPTPVHGVPRVPIWLRPAARKHWKTLAPMLNDMGVMTKADGLALALLCEPLVDYLEARAIVEADSIIAKTDNGTVYQHPAVGVMNKAWERMAKMLREFGMTPSSRSGLHVTPVSKPAVGSKERFFNVVG